MSSNAPHWVSSSTYLATSFRCFASFFSLAVFGTLLFGGFSMKLVSLLINSAVRFTFDSPASLPTTCSFSSAPLSPVLSSTALLYSVAFTVSPLKKWAPQCGTDRPCEPAAALSKFRAAPALGAPQIQQNRRILSAWPTYPWFWDMWGLESLRRPIARVIYSGSHSVRHRGWPSYPRFWDMWDSGQVALIFLVLEYVGTTLIPSGCPTLIAFLWR